MIDPHVHLRDWSQQGKETILHGLLCAQRAKVDCVFDMPNTSPSITTEALARKRIADGNKACDQVLELTGKRPSYHIYLGLESDPAQVQQMVRVHSELFGPVVGLKLFAGPSTGNLGLVRKADREMVYRTLAQSRYTGVLAVHCEDESLFVNGERPPEAEVRSIAEQLELKERYGCRFNLHVCHISTKASLDLIRGSATCACTAHHCLFSQPTELRMNPPIRSDKDREAIYQGLLEGRIDWIETDHAPHSLEDKLKGSAGIPGWANLLRLLRRLREDGIGEDAIRKLTQDNIERAFQIKAPAYRSSLASDQDIAYLDGQYPLHALD
ncbi:MAG: dihydroorotase [Sphaerochaetaceae bacterium]|jgi:dihydroorotase|nr:dihydroorotase [Sphaerochaetaceae bacterium]